MKKFFLGLLFTIFNFSLFASDWTLAVMEFSFKQTQSRGESYTRAASVLPQLVMEQFANQNTRTIPESESLDRKLKELQTARLSLFLQLSKEYKARDSLVITTKSTKALARAIKAENDKIKDIEKQIDENLDKVNKTIDEYAPKIQREKDISEGKKVEDEKTEKGFFPFKFSFPFFHKDEENKIVTESVVLYKNDSTSLFKPSQKALEAGYTSWDFEQEVSNAKINGLITGEITVYGDYCSVSVNLRIYPGGKILGSVTEVGLLADLMPLANSIARNLDSKIANALPVMLEFQIEPKELSGRAKIMIDGNVFSLTNNDGNYDNRIIEESGIHHISIEIPEYEKMSFSYSFTDDTRFLIHANLVPKVHGIANIRLKKYREGVFHTYGLLQSPVTEENPWAKLEVNSKSVLGVFRVPKVSEDDSDSSNIAFFHIPQNQAFDGANLLVNAKPFDRSANIDKRRRWMYTAYTALICSMPFTFYYMGEFTAENTAYSQGRGDYDRLQSLQRGANITLGITAVCGVWTVFELIRYLWAADRVLPAKTKIDKKADFSFHKLEINEKSEEKAVPDGESSLNNDNNSEKDSVIEIENNETIVEEGM
ncbi:MAG: hypothetical protein K5873_05440 [Treponema sp.]|nr:hypothetical protein [Treponema sp.]